jgi:hypothetical protein
MDLPGRERTRLRLRLAKIISGDAPDHVHHRRSLQRGGDLSGASSSLPRCSIWLPAAQTRMSPPRVPHTRSLTLALRGTSRCDVIFGWVVVVCTSECLSVWVNLPSTSRVSPAHGAFRPPWHGHADRAHEEPELGLLLRSLARSIHACWGPEQIKRVVLAPVLRDISA